VTRIRPAARAFSQARPRPPSFRRPLLAGAALTGAALLAAGCGPAGHSAGGGVSTPAASAPATASQPPATAAADPATSAPVAPSAPPASPSTAASSAPADGAAACATMATRAYLHLTAVRAAAAGGLTVTGNPARLVCGGPDDSHYDVGAASATGQVVAGASVITFALATMSPKAISVSQLSAYLARDQGTRIFLVSGPLTRITGLQEEFHP
jgi:hypothetical protein